MSYIDGIKLDEIAALIPILERANKGDETALERDELSDAEALRIEGGIMVRKNIIKELKRIMNRLY